MVGLGGGSLAKFVYHRLPGTRVKAVEVSPQVVAIARQLFHVPADEARFEIVIADGADYVTREDVSADVVIVDGYDADAPAEELASASFYAACRERLHPDGMLVVNLWGGDKRFATFLRRIQTAFSAGTLCLPAERPGNVIVFGFKTAPGALAWTALLSRAQLLEKELGLEFERFAEGMKKMNRHDRAFLYPTYAPATAAR
jgi:spermidine synthase